MYANRDEVYKYETIFTFTRIFIHITRCFNNLIERLHHSTFDYFIIGKRIFNLGTQQIYDSIITLAYFYMVYIS